MGTLRYDGQWVEFDDELLTHLQIVIVGKLRRGESFLMTWRDSAERGDGRSSIWLHPSHSLTFHLSDIAPVDEAWIQQLTRSANSPEGLVVTRRSHGSAPESGGHDPHRP
jgi:hypothetical protein